MVVVAGQERDPLVRKRLTEGIEERQRDVQHVRERLLTQLDDVSEQDDLVCRGESLEQHRADLRAAQNVGSRARAQVEVGEDCGQHRGASWQGAYPRMTRCRRSSAATTASR